MGSFGYIAVGLGMLLGLTLLTLVVVSGGLYMSTTMRLFHVDGITCPMRYQEKTCGEWVGVTIVNDEWVELDSTHCPILEQGKIACSPMSLVFVHHW